MQHSARPHPPARCAYCGHAVPDIDIVPAPASPTWERLATAHAANCEWIVTQAQTRLPITVVTVTLDVNRLPSQAPIFPPCVVYERWHSVTAGVDTYVVGMDPAAWEEFYVWAQGTPAVFAYQEGPTYA